jgi:hypothetical protein
MRIMHSAIAVGFLTLATINPSSAQPGPGMGWLGSEGMMGPGMMDWRGSRGMCGPRAAGLAEWRIDRIARAVQPTNEQRTALDALRAASTKAAEAIASACPRNIPDTASARLAAAEAGLETMLQAVKTIRPTFDAYYATLSADQKKRLDSAGPRGWGWQRWRWSDR